MEHFCTQDWVDFVRESTNSERALEMQQHLDEKCPECLKNMNTWRVVMQHTRQSSRTGPPDASLRAVRAGFSLRNVVSFPSGRLDLATLQFDSERQPLTVGVRGCQATARQLLYKSGSFCIDMRMEPTPGSQSIVLVGQLLDSMNPGHGIGGVSVSLLSKGDTLSRKQTNEAGEFDFGLEIGRDMQLVFGMGESRTIVVAVPEARTKSNARLM
jgi:hypothetical protein